MIYPQQSVFLSICISSSRQLCLHGAHSRSSRAEVAVWLSKHLPLQSWVTLKEHIHQRDPAHSGRTMHLQSHPERPCSLTGLAAAGWQWLAACEHPGSTHSCFAGADRVRRSRLTLGLDVTFNSRSLPLNVQTHPCQGALIVLQCSARVKVSWMVPVWLNRADKSGKTRWMDQWVCNLLRGLMSFHCLNPHCYSCGGVQTCTTGGRKDEARGHDGGK